MEHGLENASSATRRQRFAGIVNVTADSFSDGGRYLAPDAAVGRALALLADGADAVDLGAESTHPDAADVSAATEIERLAPVLDALRERAPAATLSVDTWKPEVMAHALAYGATMINDVFALRAPGAIEALAAHPTARAVLMYSAYDSPRPGRSTAPRANTDDVSLSIIQRECAFFEERLATLARAGIGRERVLLDPGMGFFLGAGATSVDASLAVLRDLDELATFGCDLYVCVSRKSFLGALTGRGPTERGAATLAAELFALAHGATWVRTHDVRAARDAWRVWSACA